jgi:hypothetical protein
MKVELSRSEPRSPLDLIEGGSDSSLDPSEPQGFGPTRIALTLVLVPIRFYT